MIKQLFETIDDRKRNPKPGSYTNHLLNLGEDEILKKISEEAVEVIIAAKGQGDQRLIEEISDITYHLLVLISKHGLKPADIEAELARRHTPESDKLTLE